MDPIRKRLVELRDDLFASAEHETEEARHYPDVSRRHTFLSAQASAHRSAAERLDKALADWDAAEEIRPREATPEMIEAATDLDNRTFLEGEWPRMDDEWQVMWDAYKQERDDE